MVRSIAFSSVVSGKYLSVGDAKTSGRQDAGRPHISIAGSFVVTQSYRVAQLVRYDVTHE
jgi:hypothetical protein